MASDHVFSRWPWSWPIRAIRAVFIELVMRPLIWLLAAPRVVRDTPELPVAPVLVIANHVTFVDGALVLYALPGRLRRQTAIAMSGEALLDLRRGRNQKNAMRNMLAPAAYWLVTALFNVFPLPARRGFQRSFAHAGEAMDRGYSVLIFPEGTRSRDGKLHQFRQGIGILTQQSRVPVVPVALVGLDEMRLGRVRWLRSGQLGVRVGKAILFEEARRSCQLTEDSRRSYDGFDPKKTLNRESQGFGRVRDSFRRVPDLAAYAPSQLRWIEAPKPHRHLYLARKVRRHP